MSDKVNLYELLYMARCNDDYAFGQLMEQFMPLFYKTYKELRNYSGSLDYDDAYEAMILGLYNAVTHYREDKSTAFSSFATLCITREMRNCYRKTISRNGGFLSNLSLDGYMQDVDNLQYGDMLLKDENANPNYQIRADVLQEEIYKNIGHGRDRQVIDLRMKGYSYQEIADKLNIKKKDVDNSLQRIRKKVAYLFD